MRVSRHIFFSLLCVLISTAFQPLFAQLGFDLKIKKPKPYENRVLKAEKTGDKKLKAPKRFMQNLTTHYNYFFNASTILNEVIDQAKEAHQDDYSTLLPFYNYSLDQTSAQKTQLDSVIYKSQTGIVMHDLRNDWIDNLYLLWGAAFYLEKEFDSASLMFQFINYSFAEKEKDGYYRYIGSRMDGNNALSISTKENNSFTKRVFSTSPSRNDAFIWQIRSLIELENYTESGSLITTLKNDPNFPERLNDDLQEVLAYWYYKQGLWDSSATHLVLALDQAKSKQERARWEYLAAQMFDKSGKKEEAQKLYTKAIGHSTDPVLEVYARLNLVRINKTGGENYIDQNIAELVKMAKRDKYQDYRDVIYYMAAQMEMERNNLPAAQEYLSRASKNNNGNLSSKNNAFLTIADLSYNQKKYLQAAAFYDSIKTNDLTEAEINKVNNRKDALSKVVLYSGIIYRQDSLQRIAAMPEQERNYFITKLAKYLRKQQGLGEENATSGVSTVNNSGVTNLFENESKGEWYFYNSALKTQGSAQFKQTWGNRPNVDNWRRFADVSSQLLAKVPNNTRDPKTNNAAADLDNIPSFKSLLSNLPLTAQAMQASNDSLQNALFGLGVSYLNDVEDYASAIETLEKLRSRFPEFNKMDEVLFNLYYAYTKSGNATQAAQIKKLLGDKYASSKFTTIATTGKDPSSVTQNSPATKDYESIYDLFIEGKFDEAEAAKKKADSIYQTNYWQPQLLYIEAVYNIRQKNDSLAKDGLQTLIRQNPNTALAKKAQNLIDVLARRSQIEDELTKLQIERPKEDTVATEPYVQIPTRTDVNINKPKNDVVLNPIPQKPVDTLSKKTLVKDIPVSNYKFDPGMKHYAMVVLNKVDVVFGNEAKNAFFRYNREKYYNQTFDIKTVDLDADNKLMLIDGFPNAQAALDYMQQAKRLASSEIVPWLKADKYSFFIMTDLNLPLLLEKKDLSSYKQFLEQNLPGKF